MKKNLKIAVLAAMMTLGLCITAFAGEWKSDSTGWWWQRDDGSYPVNGWEWVDDNGDGIQECYYFNPAGYCLLNTTTPDGYTVNADGAWVVDGAVQHQGSSSTSSFNHADMYGTYEMYNWTEGDVNTASVGFYTSGSEDDYIDIGNMSIGGSHYYRTYNGSLKPVGGNTYITSDENMGVTMTVTFSAGQMTIKVTEDVYGFNYQVFDGTYDQVSKLDFSHVG